LVDEHCDELRILDQGLAKPLDDDELAEPSGPTRHRKIDIRHPAVAQLGDQSIAAKDGVRHGETADRGRCNGTWSFAAPRSDQKTKRSSRRIHTGRRVS